MNDEELLALTAVVQRQTAEFNGCVQQFGERPWDWETKEFFALLNELQLRSIIPMGAS